MSEKDIAELIDRPEISALGINIFKFGFSPENLAVHWKKHISEYKEYKSAEQYAHEALRLIQLPTNFMVLGYKNSKGQVIRYDIETKNFVKGHPNVGIATMHKLDNGIEDYYDKERKEAVFE